MYKILGLPKVDPLKDRYAYLFAKAAVEAPTRAELRKKKKQPIHVQKKNEEYWALISLGLTARSFTLKNELLIELEGGIVSTNGMLLRVTEEKTVEHMLVIQAYNSSSKVPVFTMIVNVGNTKDIRFSVSGESMPNETELIIRGVALGVVHALNKCCIHKAQINWSAVHSELNKFVFVGPGKNGTKPYVRRKCKRLDSTWGR